MGRFKTSNEQSHWTGMRFQTSKPRSSWILVLGGPWSCLGSGTFTHQHQSHFDNCKSEQWHFPSKQTPICIRKTHMKMSPFLSPGVQAKTSQILDLSVLFVIPIPPPRRRCHFLIASPPRFLHSRFKRLQSVKRILGKLHCFVFNVDCYKSGFHHVLGIKKYLWRQNR